MKYARIVLVVIASAAVLAVGIWCFLGWTVNRAFTSAAQDGSFQKLSDVVQAAVGSTLARGDVRLKPGETMGQGALAFYQKNPQALQRDKSYFQTWHRALAIADAGRKGEHQLGRWESSAAATWIGPSQKTDAWGHAFCVESDQTQTIVVSPGPQALSSLDCNTLRISEDELAQMPQSRLNPHASGALILFVKRSSGDGAPETGKGNVQGRLATSVRGG